MPKLVPNEPFWHTRNGIWTSFFPERGLQFGSGDDLPQSGSSTSGSCCPPRFPTWTQLSFPQMFLQQYRAGRQAALRWWGIPAAVRGRPQRYPAVLQRQLAHAGYEIKSSYLLLAVTLKAYTFAQYCTVPYTSSSRVYNQKIPVFWIFSSR